MPTAWCFQSANGRSGPISPLWPVGAPRQRTVLHSPCQSDRQHTVDDPASHGTAEKIDGKAPHWDRRLEYREMDQLGKITRHPLRGERDEVAICHNQRRTQKMRHYGNDPTFKTQLARCSSASPASSPLGEPGGAATLPNLRPIFACV